MPGLLSSDGTARAVTNAKDGRSTLCEAELGSALVVSSATGASGDVVVLSNELTAQLLNSRAITGSEEHRLRPF